MLKNAKISTLLTVGFGLVIALIIGMSFVVLIESRDVSRDASYLTEDINPKATAAATARMNILRNWANTLLLMQIKDGEEIKLINSEMAENSKVISEQFDFLDKSTTSVQGRALIADILKSRQTYTDNRKTFLDMVKSGNMDKAAQYLASTLNQDIKKYINAVGKLFTHQSEKLNQTSSDIQSQASLLKSSVIGIALVATIISLLAAHVVSSAVRDILGGDAHYANKIVQEIAGGNLAVEVITQGKNTTSLLYSMKTMRDKLRSTVMGIQQSAENVGIAAEQLAQTSSAVAAASVQQSEATSATAAAVEEMTVGIDSISTNANSASVSSREASKLSQQGGEVIHGATAEMEKIAVSVESSSAIISSLEKQSNEISAIVGVIKEIADQTNLLALNAAIEAARAGENGRGFAVVADEVRKLAERTTQSTQQVAQTIGEIQKGTKSAVDSMMMGVDQVRSGATLAKQAGESIREIQFGAENVVLAVSDISNSLHEQSKASAEIARNIENIAQMVEENNSSSEQASAAAQQLHRLAEELSSSVRSFRV